MSRRGDRATLLALAIVTVAAALRVWQLGTVPLGLHNDEAWTGLNAREVLHDGWIGPYLYPSGLGQPSGPVYWTALLFIVVPQTTFTLRLSMALLGVAAVWFTYAAVRQMFDDVTGLCAAALLAVMPWHLHLSRTGFMVGAWPCVEMVILWVLFRVRAHPSTFGYAGVGLLIGAGVYTYNGYPAFLPVAATPFVYDIARAHARGERRRQLGYAAVTALTALLVMVPMARYATTHDEYMWRYRGVSLFSDGRWRDADWAQRAQVLDARAREWAQGLFAGDRPDNGDGLGDRGHPLLDPLVAVAAPIGLAMALRGWRRPACGVLLVAAAVLPLGALVTVGDGLYRRTFGLSPFLAALAALPLAWLWRRARGWHRLPRVALAAAIALAICIVAAGTVDAYFGSLQSSQLMRQIYPYQLDAAARAVAALPRDTTTYLFSDRWGARFETIRWLAPDAKVVDRSREFRKGAAHDAPLDLDREPGPTAFVLMGTYLEVTDQLRARYPQAQVQEEIRNGEILYRIVRP